MFNIIKKIVSINNVNIEITDQNFLYFHSFKYKAVYLNPTAMELELIRKQNKDTKYTIQVHVRNTDHLFYDYIIKNILYVKIEDSKGKH